MRPPRDCAATPGGGRGAEAAHSSNDTPKRTGGRPEVQGNANARNSGQPGPTWTPAPGTDAALELTRLWRRS